MSERYAIAVGRFYAELADRLGHSLHHQALPLDEQMLHEEHERDRELGRDIRGGST